MKKLFMILPFVLVLCFAYGCQDKAAMAELEAFRAQAALEEQNKELLHNSFEELDKGNTEIIKELYGSTTPLSPEEAIEMTKMFYNAFPDLTHTIDRLVAEGDMVAGQYTFRGTHKSEFSGIPPTDNKVEVTVMGIWSFADGKLAEYWTNIDSLGLMQQLGMELKPKEVK